MDPDAANNEVRGSSQRAAAVIICHDKKALYAVLPYTCSQGYLSLTEPAYDTPYVQAYTGLLRLWKLHSPTCTTFVGDTNLGSSATADVSELVSLAALYLASEYAYKWAADACVSSSPAPESTPNLTVYTTALLRIWGENHSYLS